MDQNLNSSENCDQKNSQIVPKFEVSMISENEINARSLEPNDEQTIISPFIVSLPSEEGLN